MTPESMSRKHIVIVDDEPVNLELAANALGGRYRLTKLISGSQLLRFLTRVRPDMILLDVQMPGMNGYETLAAVVCNPQTSDIPVVFLTSQESLDGERLGFRLGAKDFIKKPFDNEIMLARVQTQLELHAYRTRLEAVIDEKKAQLERMQHALKISWAEMIEARDGTTGCHIRNTTACYEVLLRAMADSPKFEDKVSEAMIAELLRASTLHDVGKLGVSEAVLQKPGPLDPDEWAHIRRHSEIGAEMIAKIAKSADEAAFERFLDYAGNMSRLHHERWDGTGYPTALQGPDIPLYVRALSIVDVYEALTAARPYKRAFSHEEALDIMREDCGRYFDPDLFDLFMAHADDLRQYSAPASRRGGSTSPNPSGRALPCTRWG